MAEYNVEIMGERRKPVIVLDNVGVYDVQAGSSTLTSVTLQRGQSVLFTGASLPLLRRLMEVCLGVASPHRGSVKWGSGFTGPQAGNLWTGYDFYRRVGYVDRFSQLLSNLTLMENLVLLFSYSRFAQDKALQYVREILFYLDLEKWAEVQASDLPEPQRRLGLYALAFCKEPFFFLMERPAQFLDRDFEKVWNALLAARKKGMLLVVFDRSNKLYADNSFDITLPFEASF